ncbi:hypothetical protein Pla108_20050 [Botrimarina colliarenosi]|uniref:Uncharacterized protein n=1 Tax=Botrimarina colliarenosi TaxID=2528001 RepID=A0A5C6ACS9_9BACT|nr:hypothetical protein [Botrimarina colliarenosi]TWT97852.1 hypothetical protein Pla108_20050 [Botrimarina colliarenosi]
MRRNLANTTSSLLAAAYLALAMFGHAWHDHGSCSDASCGSESIAACECDLHRLLAERGASAADAVEGFASRQSTGCEHDCLACIALGHLSVGYASVEPLIAEEATSVLVRIAVEAVALSARPLVYGPRGPPASGC